MQLKPVNVRCEQLLDALEVAEIHHRPPALERLTADDLGGELLCLVGLARPRRAEEHDLSLQLQGVDWIGALAPSAPPCAGERWLVEIDLVLSALEKLSEAAPDRQKLLVDVFARV